MDWIMLRSRRPFLFFFNYIIHEIGGKSKFSPGGKIGGRVGQGDDSQNEKLGSWNFVSRPVRFVQIAQVFSQNPPLPCAYCPKGPTPPYLWTEYEQIKYEQNMNKKNWNFFIFFQKTYWQMKSYVL